MTLQASDIPGVQNTLADGLSRGVSLSGSVWTLKQPVVDRIFERLWEPTVDLFATYNNRRLAVFC